MIFERTYTPMQWQKDAYQEWFFKGQYGIIEAATGSGKTIIAAEAIHRMLLERAKILYVTPGKALALQTKCRLIRYGLPESSIGMLYGGKAEYGKDVTVAVINSLRHRDVPAGLLILDEVHRACSPENFKFIRRGAYKKILGLTATLERQDGGQEQLVKEIGVPVVAEYRLKDAVADKIAAPFCLKLVRLTKDSLYPPEFAELAQLDSYIRERTSRRNYSGVRDAIAQGDYIYAKAVSRRRELLLTTPSRIEIAAKIILQELADSRRVIVFCEYTATADAIGAMLALSKASYVLYYSKLPISNILAFEQGLVSCLITVRALDEGLDVPDADVAVIVAGSGVERQLIQRVGRVLRQQPDKLATVYQIYIAQTKDEEWMKERTRPLIDAAKSLEIIDGASFQ